MKILLLNIFKRNERLHTVNVNVLLYYFIILIYANRKKTQAPPYTIQPITHLTWNYFFTISPMCVLFRVFYRKTKWPKQIENPAGDCTCFHLPSDRHDTNITRNRNFKFRHFPLKPGCMKSSMFKGCLFCESKKWKAIDFFFFWKIHIRKTRVRKWK